MQSKQEQNRVLFEESPVARAVMTMAIPTIISQLIILIYNLADTFYIGRVNNPNMVAAASLILPVFNVSIAISCISGTGGGTLIARLLGRGREDEARKVAVFSFWFTVAAGLFYSVMVLLFMEPLLKLLGASEATYGYARQYATCVIVLGAVPTVLTGCLSNLLRSVGSAKKAGLGTSMGGVINIILDPIFMFVLLPEGNEVLGAGIATALSNLITCTYFIITIIKMKDPVLQLSPRFGIPERESLGSFFLVGLPAAAGPFLFDLDYMVLNRLMSGYSDVALAAIGIVLKAERLPLNVGVGLCLGMVPLAAYNYSSGNRVRMDAILRFTRRVGIIVGIASIALYELFAPQLVRVFLDDSATVTLGAGFMRVRALATIFMFLSFIYVHLFQAMGQGKHCLGLVIFRWAIVNVPMLFLLDALFGMYGLVWGQLCGDLIVALVSYLVYRRFIKRTLKQ